MILDTHGDAVDTLDEAWLDAVFAATREARVRRAPHAKALVLVGADVAQLRWMLRLRRVARARVGDLACVIELRNTRSRVASLRLHASRFLSLDVAGRVYAELRDGETLARWLCARGIRAPFEAWRSDRGSLRSPR